MSHIRVLDRRIRFRPLADGGLAALAFLFALAPAGQALEQKQTDIFSTPDTMTPPTFAARNRPAQFCDPLFGPNGEPPGRDSIRAIPSITPAQLKKLDELINQNRDQQKPIQDELDSLRRIQERNKALKSPAPVSGQLPPPLAPDLLHRDGSMMESMAGGSDSGVTTFDSDEAIKARAAILRQQQADLRAQLWPNIKAMLTGDQLNQLAQMRHGQLVIASTASTDIPEPVPAAKPNSRSDGIPPGSRMRPPLLRPPFTAPYGTYPFRQYVPQPYFTPVRAFPPQYPVARPGIVAPLLNTTRQLLYQSLWRL